MSAAFHKGILNEMVRRVQLIGVRIDTKAAHNILSGFKMFPPKHPLGDAVQEIEFDVLRNRHELMRVWEGAHPGENAFPPSFAEVVLAKLRGIDLTDQQGMINAVNELIKLAESELSGE